MELDEELLPLDDHKGSTIDKRVCGWPKDGSNFRLDQCKLDEYTTSYHCACAAPRELSRSLGNRQRSDTDRSRRPREGWRRAVGDDARQQDDLRLAY